jgi:hypothetical protein
LKNFNRNINRGNFFVKRKKTTIYGTNGGCNLYNVTRIEKKSRVLNEELLETSPRIEDLRRESQLRTVHIHGIPH